jgi:hypothetical protein
MISLCVAARNEAQRIPRLLRSVRGVVSHVCLLDNASTDGTLRVVQDICHELGVPLTAGYEPEAKGYPDHLYNRLLEMPTQPWTLLLDADEELTAEGRRMLMAMPSNYADAYYLPRATIISRDGQAPLIFNEHHYRFFKTGTVRYPEGDNGPHQVPLPMDGAVKSRVDAIQPLFIQYRDAREQLRRDKLRGQYPETPLPPYYQSVPGWFDYEAIFDLMVEEARPGGHIVEVGCWLGKSTCYLGQKAKETGKNLTVWAVDHFRGSDEAPHREFFAQGRNLYAECMRNLDGAGLLDTVRVLPVESRQGVAALMDIRVESVYLDASHDYNSVWEDILWWKSKIRTGGILAGHDYSSAWPGVMQAVDEANEQREIDKTTSPGSWLVRL